MNKPLWHSSAAISGAILVIYLVALLMVGGSSRADEPAQLFARLGAIAFGLIGYYRIEGNDLRRVRLVLIGLFALVALMVVQLIPLSPVVWQALPGRAQFVTDLFGQAHRWRPVSLTPDNTLNALLALLPSACVLLLMAKVSTPVQPLLVKAMLGCILLSAAFEVGQIAADLPNLYGFRAQGFDRAAGFFANRNHQAALLACALPLIAHLTRGQPVQSLWAGIAGMTALVILPLIVVTGSRAGLLLGLIGIAAGALIFAVDRERPVAVLSRRSRNRLRKSIPLITAGALATFILLIALSARTQLAQRMFQEDVAQEIRLQLFVPLLRIGWTYFPVGAGFGSFVDVFKVHETMGDLRLTYLNHAHNELLELFIEGGAVAIAAAGLGVVVFARAAFRAWHPRFPRDRAHALSRLGSVLIVMLVLASLADYPLRTPFISVVFAIAAVWSLRLLESTAPSGDDPSFTAGR